MRVCIEVTVHRSAEVGIFLYRIDFKIAKFRGIAGFHIKVRKHNMNNVKVVKILIGSIP
jgi:hypothetical protein